MTRSLTHLKLALVALASVAFVGGSALAADYKVDPVHTTVLFKIKHLDVAPFYGLFTKSAGTLTFDPASPTKSKLELVVQTSSVFTADKKRDAHLKSPDFFGAKQFPTITFKSTSVTPVAKRDGVFTVAGTLSLHGKTKQVTVEVAKTGEGQDPWGGTRIGFEGTLEISRAAFDIGPTFAPPALSDAVTLTIAIEAIKQ